MKAVFDEKAIGVTSTVPLEIIFAAGLRPVDLNNRFITHTDRRKLVEEAEAAGFPLNFCAWIKGIYSYAVRSGIARVIGVRQGDCSNTHVLMEVFEDAGVDVIPFDYPCDRTAAHMNAALGAFAERLGTTLAKAEKVRREMRGLRERLEILDRMTWRGGRVTPWENHLWLINSSDMKGDWRVYERALGRFLAKAAGRPARRPRFRLAFAGIPPIVDDIYDVLDERGAAVVFNEFQRQFSMPGRHESLVGQYLAYTYPYGTPLRIADIRRETVRRRLDGIVHYVQSFCFRQLSDRMIRREAGVPVLTLEFDRPGGLDAGSLTRIEAFIEMLEGTKRSEDN